MEEKILSALAQMNQRFDKMEQKIIEEMRQEMNQRFLDQAFGFEHDYGTKIDAIFDAVTMELDKNLEKSVKIRKLDNRMDRAEVTVFNHEKRISTLELNH